MNNMSRMLMRTAFGINDRKDYFSRFNGPKTIRNEYPVLKSMRYGGEIGTMLELGLIEKIPDNALTVHQKGRLSYQYMRVTPLGMSAFLQDCFLSQENAYIRKNVGYRCSYGDHVYQFAISAVNSAIVISEVRQVAAIMLADQGILVPRRQLIRVELCPELDTIVWSDPKASDPDVYLSPRRVYEVLREQYGKEFTKQYTERSYESPSETN